VLRFAEVRPTGGHVVEARLTDGSTRLIDLEPWLGGAIFDEIRSNDEAFNRVYVDEISRTLAWPGGIDLDPDVLLDPEWVASLGEMSGSH
jgi:hypothetical protein